MAELVVRKTQRIFLSYGHDAYASFARQLCRDLEQQGYDVWFDLERIKPGVEWEEYIRRGLNWVEEVGSAGQFVLILTPHSVREPDGWCLRELQRALDLRIHVVPLLLADVEIPLSISRLQYLDCRAAWQPADHPAAYQDILNQLVDALEYREAEDGGVFRAAPAAPPAGSLVDRQEVLEELKNRLQEEANPLVLLVGPSGFGKTAILHEVCSRVERQDPAMGFWAVRGMYVDCNPLAEYPLLLFTHVAGLLSAENRRLFERDWLNESLPLTARVEMLFRLLAHHPCLLVLDNLERLQSGDGSLVHPEHALFFRLLMTRRHSLRVLAASQKALLLEHDAGICEPVYLEKGLDPADATILLQKLARSRLKGVDAGTFAEAAEKTMGIPFQVTMVAYSLRRDPSLDLEELLGDASLFSEEVTREHEKRLAWYHSLLDGSQQQVVRALAVFRRPVPVDAVRVVLGGESSNSAIRRTLRNLVNDHFVIYDEEHKTYTLHSLNREYAYRQIPAGGEDGLPILHRRAADYYARILSGFESEEEDGDSYLGWFRYEHQDYQESIAEWLRHLALADDLENASLSIAVVYFKAFWWWGWYIPFPLCDDLVRFLQQSRSLKGGKIARLLDQFHQGWVLARQFRGRAGLTERWQAATDALLGLRSLLDCNRPLAELKGDLERVRLRALSDILLGESARFLPGGHPLEYLKEAYAISCQVRELEWSKSWVLYHIAEVMLDRGEFARVVEVVRHVLEEAGEQDHEVRATIFRVLGDAYWKAGNLHHAWLAYQVAFQYDYRYQGEPQPPDIYSIEMLQDLMERLFDRLVEWHACDPGGALAAALEMRCFLSACREEPSAGSVSPEIVTGWLAHHQEAELTAYIFPPLPQRNDPVYAARAVAVTDAMKEQVSAMIKEVLP